MASNRSPNVLFLFPDQHRGDWLPGLPGSPVKMPTVEHLASRGVCFSTCITPSPLCAPARACVATGRDYDRAGVWSNEYNLPPELPTIYQALRGGGYEVASFGKLDLAKDLHDWGRDGKRLMTEWGFTAGFDSEGKYDGTYTYARSPDDPPGPYLRYLKSRGLARDHARDFEKRHGFLGSEPTSLPDDAYCDSWIGRNAVEAIRGFERDRPWFLQVNFTGPHNPMDVTKRMHERWRDADVPAPVDNENDPAEAVLASRRNYAAMLENIDEWCGEMYRAIEDRGELDNTIIVYSSDHGEMLGDHGAWGKSIWRRPSLHVPLLISVPGGASGVTCDTPVSLTDLAATLLDLCGASAPVGMDSQTLRPIVEGSTSSGSGDRHLVQRPHPRSTLFVAGKAKPGTPIQIHGFRTLVSGDYAYTLEADGTKHLFSWSADPDEQHDLAESEPERCRTMHQKLIGPG